MECWVPCFLILILIYILIHGRIEVKWNKDFFPVPKMVKQHKIVCANAVKPGVESNIFDDGLKHESPQRLD